MTGYTEESSRFSAGWKLRSEPVLPVFHVLVVVLESDRCPFLGQIEDLFGHVSDLPLGVRGGAHVPDVHQHPRVHRHHDVDFRPDRKDEPGVLGRHAQIEQFLVGLDRVGDRLGEYLLTLLDGFLVDASGLLVAAHPVGIRRRRRENDQFAVPDVVGIDVVEGDVSHRLDVECDVSVTGDLGHTRAADSFDSKRGVRVFERTEMAMTQEMADERLHPVFDGIAVDLGHDFLEGLVGDELGSVVVTRGLTDQFLGVLSGFQQANVHTRYRGGGGNNTWLSVAEHVHSSEVRSTGPGSGSAGWTERLATPDDPDTDMTSDSADVVDEERREELLDRISKRGSTIGAQIPEEVTIDDQTIALRSFVWETKKQGVVPPEKRESVQQVRAKLKRERDRLKDRLRNDPLSPDEAEELTETIVGIDRAISALKSLREPDLQEHAHEEYVESNRRWVNFIDQLT
jgi:hypothetical protein